MKKPTQPKKSAAQKSAKKRAPSGRAASRGGAALRERAASRDGAASHRARRSSQPRSAESAPAAGEVRPCWLVKTEASLYAYRDLERDGRTSWEGVANSLALIHLRAMREGDPVLVYHTGVERSVAGLARVARGPYPDPALGDEKRVVVDLAAVAGAKTPVSVDAIRKEPACRDLALLRIPRLSVMPVPPAAFAWIAKTGGLPPGA